MIFPFYFHSFMSPAPPIGHEPSSMHFYHESHWNFCFHFFMPPSNPPTMFKDIYLFYYERYMIIGINSICSRADFWGACLQTHFLSWYSHCCCWPLSLFCFLSGSGEVLLTALVGTVDHCLAATHHFCGLIHFPFIWILDFKVFRRGSLVHCRHPFQHYYKKPRVSPDSSSWLCHPTQDSEPF